MGIAAVLADSGDTGMIDPWVQRGALGILGIGVVWFLFKGIPLLLASHEKAMAAMLELAREESKACREERERQVENSMADREKDRQFRHDQATLFQKATGELFVAIGELKDAVNRLVRTT